MMGIEPRWATFGGGGLVGCWLALRALSGMTGRSEERLDTSVDCIFSFFFPLAALVVTGLSLSWRLMCVHPGGLR